MVAGLIAVVSVDNLGQTALAVVSLATPGVALAGLASFRRSDWYQWQRTRPSAHEGPPIGRLVTIGVVVGMLGGLVGPVDDGLDIRVNVADR